MTKSESVRRTPLYLIAVPLALLVLAACGGQEQGATASKTSQPAGPLAPVALQTFDGRYIQIDACPNTIPPFPNLPPFSGLVVGCGTNWAGDANLVSGNDSDMLLSIGKTSVTQPGPASMSANFPVASAASPTYIDWNDLTGATDFANHFRSDFTAGQDPTAFPGSDSCVGSANVLDKMNLTYVSVSNNTEYAYFGVQRRDNNGDTGYMWIFNKLAPPSFGIETSLLGTNDGLGDNCGAAEYPLTFKVSTGDILFRGHFAPSSSEPLLTVYSVTAAITASSKLKESVNSNTVFSATCDVNGPCYFILPAKTAINWQILISQDNFATNAGFWTVQGGFVAGAAVNLSPAGLASLGDTSATSTTGGIGKVGLKSPMATGDTETEADSTTWKCTDANGCMPSNIFAEVAVPISAFIQGSVCGATFYGSVISRSSGTTPSPDMKDLAGPYQLNFGNASLTAQVTATCGTSGASGSAQFDYKLNTFTGVGGGSVTPSTCNWYLDDSTTAFATTCNFTDATQNVADGAHTVKVTASDGTCSASSPDMPVTVWKGPSVAPSMSSACANLGTAAAPKVGFSFAANASDVHGTAAYSWTFTPASYTYTFTSGSTSSASGAATVPVPTTFLGATFTGSLSFTDTRGSLVCPASGSNTTTPYLPVVVSLAASPASLTCTTPNSDFSTDGTFTASAVGGSTSGVYAFTWGGCSSATGATCTVTEPNTCGVHSVNVKVTDAVCGASNNPSGTYTKTTAVSATVP